MISVCSTLHNFGPFFISFFAIGDSGGRLLALMLEDSDSEVEETQNVVLKASYKKKWIDRVLHFLIRIIEERYWEHDRKAFKPENWEFFVDVINGQFSNETPRTCKQTKKKWENMRSLYNGEKYKQLAIGRARSTWTLWFVLFDGMYFEFAKVNDIPNSMYQGSLFLYKKQTCFK